MSKIKGSSVLSVVNFIKEKGGEDLMKKILNEMQENDRKQFSVSVLPNSWYQLDSYQRMMETAAKNLSGGNPDIGIEIGHKIIKDGLTGFYKVLIGFISAQYISSKIPMLWKNYFDDEKLEIVEVDKLRVQSRVSGPTKPVTVYCNSVLGGMMQAIELTGGKNVHGRETCCRKDGNQYCEFSLTWE
jgi:hypothetical protein